MLRLHLFVTSLLITLGVIGQEVVALKGAVLNDTISKSALTVVNVTFQKGVITNSNGVFEILVRENDTINVSAVHYESRQFVVNKAIFDRKKISLYLIPKITVLEEVNVSNIDLTGNILRDVGLTQFKIRINPKDLGIPDNTAPERTVEERRYHTAISSSGGISLDGLINALSGRLKMLKRNIEVSRFVKKVQDARVQFSDAIYVERLKIPEALIEDFVYYIFEDEVATQYVNKGDVLGLLDFMIKESAKYRELKAQEKH